MNILISGACGVTSRAIARSIRVSKAFAECRLIGTDICNNIYAIHEGLYDRLYRVPLTTSDNYWEITKKVCTQEGVDVALVVPEPEVLHWARSNTPVKAFLPPPKFCEIAISKRRLYEVLRDSDLIPECRFVRRNDILGNADQPDGSFPMWLRDFSEGGTSGKGAYKCTCIEEMRAWAVLNRDIETFMLAEYLPGRNFACCMLYHNDELIRTAVYERLEYFMAHVVMSGISGNISRGRLVNEPSVQCNAAAAVDVVRAHTRERMSGLVTVDLKEDSNHRPLVTEINLRHTAATSAFAAAGANMVEAQLYAALDRPEQIESFDAQFPPNNVILRDIDGLPIWIAAHKELAFGDFHSDS